MKDMIKKGQNISLKMTLLGNLFLIKKKIWLQTYSISEKHNKKTNEVIISLSHCFMRLLYPIFCVGKQTNMITVMKNRTSIIRTWYIF